MAILVANRYARALADVVRRAGNYAEILRELEDFAAVYRESAELREVFETPTVPLPEKMKVLDALMARLGTSQVSSNFLRVLLSYYRMNLLEEVVEAFRKEVNKHLGIVQVRVFSASELSEAEREALRASFSAMTKKKVTVEFHLEEGLLGGIRAQIGSTVYDGSVRGHLERIREQLMAR